MRLEENVVLGLDIGIASIGWALLRDDPETGKLHLLSRQSAGGEEQYALGTRVFSAPEDPKTLELLNVKRRNARQQRRVIRRRAQRMRQVRRLLAHYGMDQVLDPKTFHLPRGKGSQPDPWTLRREGLVRLLSRDELARVLLHMARHRGFLSNSKRDAADREETGKMLQGVSRIRSEVLAANTTVGAYMASQQRKRNRRDHAGNAVYDCTLPRMMLKEETDILCERQQALGSAVFSTGLRDAYKQIAFDQRPLASVAGMVGRCVFLEEERRAPAFSPTAERFRLAQRLTILRLKTADGESRPLRAEEINRVLGLQGRQTQASVTYKTLRKLLRLPDDTVFESLGTAGRGLNGRDPESADIVRRSGAALAGSAVFLKCLGENAFDRIYRLRLPAEADAARSRCLDYLARILSENDDLGFIMAEMDRLPLEERERACLQEALGSGTFASFRGTMRLSLKAMEAILPHLSECGDYAQACEMAGFDHRRERAVDINDIRNPVVQHVLREVRRQVAAVCNDWNLFPGRVHIELLREVGKSARERKQISKGLDDRTKARQQSREELAELFNIPAEQVSGGELLRYELWKEQGKKCAYHMLWRDAGGSARYAGECAEGYIPVSWLRDGSNAAQVDHILPRSRTFDNSFHNLCLCCAAANQAKGGKTPYEWLGRDHPDAWHSFSQWVRATFSKGLKKRNFLLENLNADTQNRFHARNLVDSSYVARLVAAWFRGEYERRGAQMLRPDGTEMRRVFARPGAVTAFLRRQWGVERLKKSDDGRRLEDDRHHAIDALVLACCTEGQLQRITRLFQKGEEDHADPRIPLPWEDFYRDAADARDRIFVSRALRPARNGALHEETLRAVRTEKGAEGDPVEVVYERRHIAAIKEADLDSIKDAVRCPDVLSALRTWLALPQKERQLEANLPRSAHGDVIRHVRVRSKSRGGVRLRRGDGWAQADNSEMPRVDVYAKDGKYSLVPVYLKQLADGELPVKAIVGGKSEEEWAVMDADWQFCFSLEKDCYVLTEKKSGEILEGYFISADRSTGAITLSHMQGRALKPMRGIGVQRLARFEKYIVDRLGRLHRVTREPDPRVRHGNGLGQA